VTEIFSVCKKNQQCPPKFILIEISMIMEGNAILKVNKASVLYTNTASQST